MASSRNKISAMERKLFLTQNTTGKSQRIASELAKPSKLKPSEQAAAAAVINPRRVLDQSRALARAKGSVARAEKKAAAAKMLKATTGGPAKKQAPKPAAKKAAAKPTSSFGGNARQNVKKKSK
jgi:hypothetical protein